MTYSLDPHHARDYRRRARYIVLLGASALLIGIAGVARPELLASSSFATTLDSPIVTLYLAAYAAGGLLAVIGVARLSPAIEVLGDWLLLVFALVNAAAILITRGPVGGGITAASILLAAWVLAGRIGDLHAAANVERRAMPDPRPPTGAAERRRRLEA